MGAVQYNTSRGSQQRVVAWFLSVSMDDFLKCFCEVENCEFQGPSLSMEEQVVVDHFTQQVIVNHFNSTYTKNNRGRFIVPLPRREDTNVLGESRSLAVQQFTWLEHSLWARGKFLEFADAVQEYIEQGHAEPVPSSGLEKPCKDVFYLPMYAVTKTSSSTKQLRVVFHASAKSRSSLSLNDQLLVGQTVHACLIGVLLWFRCHRVELTADRS